VTSGETQTARSGSPLLAVERLTKTFPGVVANYEIDLELYAGEIHAVLGENGAGKTTLMGAIYGLNRPDSGRIRFDGVEVELDSPRAALALGIGYVQQHFSLIPTLTVAENLVLSLRSSGEKVAMREGERRVEGLSKRYGLDVPPDVTVENLSVGQQQRAEVLKALAKDARVLILDEPTSVVTPQEAAELATVLQRLASEGVGIFLISHKLEEVLRIAHRITVLRHGRLVGTLAASEATQARLAEMMVGSLASAADTTSRSSAAGEPVLVVDHLSIPGDYGRVGVRDVTFVARAGEVVGVAGVEGSGQVELMEGLAGVRPCASGSASLVGEMITDLSARERQRRGVAHVPADRLGTGLVGTLSVAENLVLPVADDERFSRYGVMRRTAVTEHARSLIADYDIRVAGPDVLAGTLSGGNQQRLVLARELSRSPVVVLASFATRGLDFASTEAVHRRILEMRDGGACVLYASVELDELLMLTDRIIVFHHGTLTGELPTVEATSEQLGLLMGGSAA
jgi:simple sugar transport system ATP-binding protein